MSSTNRNTTNKKKRNIGQVTREVICQEGQGLLTQSNSKAGLMAILLVVVCTMVFVVHWPALSAHALSFDDNQYLTENLLVKNPSWASARRFLTEILEPSTVMGYYQPLSMISLMVDYASGGRVDNLMPFHRTSLILHAANTALIIILLYLLFAQPWIAAAVGLLFGLHPMTVEPISWIGERKTLLAAFFALWCLIFYVRFVRKGGWKLYSGCLLMYVLALMSKPTSTPLPVLMLLMDFWPLKRLKWRTVLDKLPFFAIGFISAIITYISQNRTARTILPSEYGPAHIPLIICHNIIFYPYKMLYPVNLSSNYTLPDRIDLSVPMVLTGVIATCVLITLLVTSLRWTRGLLTGWLFFFIAILPTMQIIRFGNVIASDKFAYLPSFGIIMILASFLSWLCVTSKLERKSVLIVIVTVVVLVLCGVESIATRRYLANWRDTTSLYEHMLKLTPGQVPLYNNLGWELYSKGKIDEAIGYYLKAQDINPNDAKTHNNLANALKAKGQLEQAEAHYRKALEIAPRDGKVHNNFGILLASEGRLDEAISHYRKALELMPESIEIRNNLAITLQSEGKFSEAINLYNQGLKLGQDSAALHNNLSLALATHPDPNSRDVAAAITHAQRAVELTHYKDAAFLRTLAIVYGAAGQFEQAIITAQKALSIATADKNDRLACQIQNQIEQYRLAKP
jgi:tetratricopeptide (TPR) repeat protein